MQFAEVIGDPIAQSKSPIIHKHWLAQLGIDGDYLRTSVAGDELSAFLDSRRADPDWRGCNVTIPHKERIIPMLDRLDPAAEAMGAVNCVVPRQDGLIGFNTDIDGIAAALDWTELEGRKAAIIGGGGAARALVFYLAAQGSSVITLLVRDPAKADALRVLAPGKVTIVPLDRADEGLEGAAAIINASPLGMAGAAPMPPALLEAIARHSQGATLFDMVTTPAATPFLAAGLTSADRIVDGLTMLIGQARRAFELFFGKVPPLDDGRLRELLTT